ncbi:MAG: hypothetical protein OXF20_00505 [Gammaproteobacteria bacterium]|nr:hypothetical protein [Gammaproteobacteria bacterium]
MPLLQTQHPPISPADSDYSSVLNSGGTEESGFLLDHLSLISVTGSDAEKFLQNQFSNDVSEISGTQAQLNAYCNPKGRALAMLCLMKRPDDGYWMIVPNDLTDGLIKRLRIYVMRAKVTISLEEEHAMLGLLGDRAEMTDINTYKFSGHISRSIAIGNPKRLFGEMNMLGSVLNSDYWRLSDILSGLPQVYSQTVEQCIPQHINMDIVSGINFSKGCYPGQEIIARLRYLGKSKYRLCAASVVSEDPIEPGQALFEKGHASQKAGLVVDAVETGKREYLISAMLKFSAGKHPATCLGSGDAPVLCLRNLPYEVPVE